MDTQPGARGYMVMCTWDTRPREHGYTATRKWIYSQLHVDIQPRARGYKTSDYTWGLIRIRFKDVSSLWPLALTEILRRAHKAEPDLALWPTVFEQIMGRGP
jgi:hypothetical protein